MTLKQWLIPGVILTLLSSGLAFASNYAVRSYKVDRTESDVSRVGDKTEAAINDLRSDLLKRLDDWQRDNGNRFVRLEERLDNMSVTGSEVARLQEKCTMLESRLSEVKSEIREQQGKNEARWDNLSMRLNRVEPD